VNGIPKLMAQCFDFLRANGLMEPGLFRVSGDSSVIQTLKKNYDYSDDVSHVLMMCGGVHMHGVT